MSWGGRTCVSRTWTGALIFPNSSELVSEKSEIPNLELLEALQLMEFVYQPGCCCHFLVSKCIFS